MDWENIEEAKNIPYFDHDDSSMGNTIKNSAKRRDMSPIGFAIRKIRNIILYRWAYMCPINSWRVKLHRRRGCHIGKNTYVGMHCILDNAYPEYIYIGDNVSLAGEVTVVAHSNPYEHFAPVVESKVAPVAIKDGAWIGLKSAVLMGVTIGENAIVSAGTIVDKDVPDYSIAKGNPMKIVTSFESLMK